jgi:hypothetical protein
MRVSNFLALASIPSVLSQESIIITTSLITITPAPSTTPIAVSQAFIGYSTERALDACQLEFYLSSSISHCATYAEMKLQTRHGSAPRAKFGYKTETTPVAAIMTHTWSAV